jgi:hypothetical protein
MSPAKTQEPLFCLQCTEPLMLLPGRVFEVSDHTGVFLGYLHKNCLANWRQKNPGCTVGPLTRPND